MNDSPKLLIIPEFEHLEASVALAEKTGAAFEYNDFYFPKVYGDKGEIERRIGTYRALSRDRSGDTLHGAFFDIAIASHDKKIRDYSRDLIRQSAEIAARLGVRGVIYHTGILPNLNYGSYQTAWLNAAEEVFRPLCREYPNLHFYMENTFEQTPEVLVSFAERMSDMENLSLCLDYAHASLTSTLTEKWVADMAPYIGHIHLNDNDLEKDRHWAPGEGKINFRRFRKLLAQYHVHAPILLELNGIAEQEKAISFIHSLYSGEEIL